MLYHALFYPLTPSSLILINEEWLTANLSLDSLVHGLHEQGIHLLKGDTLSLRHEEETPHAHGDKDGGEEKVRTVSEIADHVWRAARNDERTQPCVCGSKTDAQHTDIKREDLRRICPGNALPCCANDECIDVHAHHGQVAPTVTVDSASGSSGGGIGFHDVSANVPHGNTAQCGAPDETLAAADTLDDDEGECAHAECFGDAVEASGEEFERGTRDAKSFKDSGGVVGDDVDLMMVSDGGRWWECRGLTPVKLCKNMRARPMAMRFRTPFWKSFLNCAFLLIRLVLRSSTCARISLISCWMYAWEESRLRSFVRILSAPSKLSPRASQPGSC